MDIHQRMERLEQRVADLEKEIFELKQRKVDNTYVPQNRSQLNQMPQVPNIPSIPPGQQPVFFQSTELSKAEEKDWEHIIARVWLPRIFMFVLLIGLIWGFKAAVDGGYLTRGMRCILGYLVSAGFVFLGFKQHREKRPLLAQVLLGGSIGVLMLTTFATHYLYDFISGTFAFMLNVIWVILGLWFSHKFNSQALGILASAAGVLTPFLVHNDDPMPVLFVTYEVTLYVAFMVYAIHRRFLPLFYTSFALLHVALTFYGGMFWEDRKIISLAILVQHIILLVTCFMLKNLVKQQLGLLVASFALTALWFKTALPTLWFNNTMLIMLIGYAVLSSWFWYKEKTKLPYTLTIATYAGLFYLFNVVQNDGLPALLLLQGLIAVWLGFVIHSKLQKINGFIIYFIGSIHAFILLLEGMENIISSHLLVWIVVFITLIGIQILVTKYGMGSHTNDVLIILNYGTGILFLLFLTDVTNAITQKMSSNAQHLLVSTVWVAYSIALITFGVYMSKKKVRLAGIALLFLTLIKVIFFDLPTVSVVIKAILFIGLGGIGVILSRLFYRKDRNEILH